MCGRFTLRTPAHALAAAFATPEMPVAHAVGPAVNNPRNDGADLLSPTAPTGNESWDCSTDCEGMGAPGGRQLGNQFTKDSEGRANGESAKKEPTASDSVRVCPKGTSLGERWVT